jgi:hypothetical protein
MTRLEIIPSAPTLRPFPVDSSGTEDTPMFPVVIAIDPLLP